MSASVASSVVKAGAGRRRRRELGVGVIGFGWLGQAHSRSLLRIDNLLRPPQQGDPDLPDVQSYTWTKY